ncbi:MAG: carboxypeptidase-like regulatory domain-containing protein, partial [Acidobacteriaceae bacterium]
MRHRENRPNFPRSAFLLLVLILLAVAGAGAQSDTGGSVAGQISGISGNYFRALVTLRNMATGVELESLSDTSGHFRFAEVEPGVYSVRINAPGVAPWRATNITVEMGQTTFLEPRMTVAFIDHRHHSKSYTPQTDLTPAVSSSLDESFLDNL